MFEAIFIVATSFVALLLISRFWGFFFVSRNDSKLNNSDLIPIGFMSLTIGITLFSILFPEETAKYAIQLLILITVFALIFMLIVSKRIKTFSISISELVLLLLLVFFSLFSGGLLKLHASPDTHGIAAAVGWFTNNPSYSHLTNEFMRYTGLDNTEMLGQPTPKLGSTWNIPDATLRFTSDHILTVGRIGIALIIATFSQFSDTSISFIVFIPLLGVFAAWMTSKYSIAFFRELMQLMFNKAVDSNKFLFSSTAILFFAASPISVLMIAEGAVPQLFTFAAIAWQLALGIRLLNSNRDHKRLFNSIYDKAVYGIGPLFVACIYPQGLLPMIPVLLLPLVLRIFHPKKTRIFDVLNDFGSLFIATIPSVLVTFYLNQFTFIQMAKEFLSLATGSPYHPGYLTLSSALFQPFTELIFTKVSAVDGGFRPDLTSASSALLQIYILLAITLSCFLIILFTRRQQSQDWRPILILILFGCSFVMPMLRILSLEIPVSSYFYVRALQSFLVIGFPILCVVIVGAVDRISTIFNLRWLKFTSAALGALILCLQLFGASHMLNEVKVSGKEFIITSIEDSKLINSNQTIIVTDQPDPRIFSLTLQGPNFYLTDNWAPHFYPEDFEDKKFNVVYIQLGSQTKVTKIGSYYLSSELEGPITMEELIKDPHFTAMSNSQ